MNYQYLQQHWTNVKNVLSGSSQIPEDILSDSIYTKSRRDKTKVENLKKVAVVTTGDGEDWLVRDREAFSVEMGIF